MKEQLSLDYSNIPYSAKIAKALSSEVRLQILRLLEKQPKNLSEVADELKIPISTTSMHIKVLEKAELVVTQSLPGVRGNQRVCALCMGKVEFLLHETAESLQKNLLVYKMPIGNYFDCSISAPCGIVSEEGFISPTDDVSGFYSGEKHTAQLIWMGNGFLEYRFHNHDIKRVDRVKTIEFSFEICSEAPAYNNEWKSDVTVWVNKKRIGAIRCNGDYGGRPGKLNPQWWSMDFCQFGDLHTVTVSEEGSYVDHAAVPGPTVDALKLDAGDYFTLRLGFEDSSEYIGGMNLFGDKFGDYPQNIELKVSY